MKREEILRRLEERLASGEIGEATYLEIKARYDAVPEVPEPPETPEPEARPRSPGRDILGVVDEAIERVMEQVGQELEEALDTEEFHRRMETVGDRLREAMAQMGPREEAGGRRIVIRGAGVFAGDRFVDEFKCSGAGKVEGDLRAQEVRISGACKIAGACEAVEFHSSGTVKVGAGLTAQEFHSSGSAKLGGDLRSREVSTSGTLVVDGSILDAQEVTVGGRLRVKGSVHAQEFVSKGRFEIGDALEAREVDVRLAGTSRVPVIRAREVRVRGGRRQGELVTDRIEAREADLEGTRAGLVRGRQVRIGPYSIIDTVEADEVEVHETATVRNRRPREAAGPEPPEAESPDQEEE